MGRRTLFRLYAALLLLLFFGLALSSAAEKSPTFDEQGFIVRGLAYLRGEKRDLRVGHPLGLNALNSALLLGDETVRLPVADPSWAETSFHRPAELFLWEIGNDVRHVIFLARLPTIWLGLLLAALAARWAAEMSGRGLAGALALTLVALDPNILAHARLATTDLGLTAGALLAGYTLWRFLRAPSWGRAVVAGAGFGLLQDTKFTAGLFVPLLALVILLWLVHAWRRQGRRAWRPLLMLIVAYPLAGLLTLWAAYGFQVGTLPADLPTFSRLGGLTLPLSHHLEQLLDIGGRLQVSTPSFLLGAYSDSGWWYYFPVAFLLKTPLPSLLLLLASLVYAGYTLIRKPAAAIRPADGAAPWPRYLDYAALLLPAVGYFAFALTTDINLGYRHILPTLPFFYVFAAVVTAEWSVVSEEWPSLQRKRSLLPASYVLLLILGLLLFTTTARIHPHYLAYFNLLGGGPDEGWRALVDSNLDWGQDLANLQRWMAANGVEEVWLSYFGEGRPEYYGIRYTGLDSFPPRLMAATAQPFYPAQPAPGIYAISATNLQGVHFQDHDRFAWFRDREPLAKVGYSIFLYRVPARGEPVDLALGGLQLAQIAPADYALLDTNQVTPHWFDPGQSWLLPPLEPSRSWLALAQGQPLHPAWEPLLADAYAQVGEGAGYSLYRQQEALPLPPSPLATFGAGAGAGTIRLWQVEGVPARAAPGETISLITTWEQGGEPQPLQLFLHAHPAGTTPVAQWDGLGVPWQGWRRGDRLYQAHTLTLPESAPAGNYQLWAGIYQPQSGARWQTAGGDRFLLGTFEVSGDE